MKSITFLDEEYNVLNKIASKTGMDCWFYICVNDEGDDVILDLENNDEVMHIEEAIQMLLEGIDNTDILYSCDLSKDELVTLCNLLSAIDLHVPKLIKDELTHLDFSQALRLIKGRYAVSRKGWNDGYPSKKELLFMKYFDKKTYICQIMKITKEQFVDLSSEDILASDWYLV